MQFVVLYSKLNKKSIKLLGNNKHAISFQPFGWVSPFCTRFHLTVLFGINWPALSNSKLTCFHVFYHSGKNDLTSSTDLKTPKSNVVGVLTSWTNNVAWQRDLPTPRFLVEYIFINSSGSPLCRISFVWYSILWYWIQSETFYSEKAGVYFKALMQDYHRIIRNFLS